MFVTLVAVPIVASQSGLQLQKYFDTSLSSSYFASSNGFTITYGQGDIVCTVASDMIAVAGQSLKSIFKASKVQSLNSQSETSLSSQIAD